MIFYLHRRVALSALITLAVVRLVLTLNLPINFLYYAGHDDGLFMRLATNLASGHWLGSFSQFTLMKGPGYPIFLMLTSFSGLPVSATHALFQIFAVAFTAWVVYRLTASRGMAALTYVVLLFHPVAFVPEVQRVIRDQIYWGQALFVFSLFSLLLFAPPRKRSARIAVAVLAGVMFGWAWLTREEGVWFLPGLGLLLAGGILVNRSASSTLFIIGRNVCIAAVAFVAVNAVFMTCNFFAYGAFVGVDVKESNFKAVLSALQSVKAGPVVPYLPVPFAARSEVAKISPTFEPLNKALAPSGPLSRWGAHGCSLYKQTCGDIAGGWFMWALRDAAAMNNFYENPKLAAQNFGRIAEDIETACADGRLRCRIDWDSYLPAMTYEQWGDLPTVMWAVAAKVSFLQPPNVNGEAQFDSAPSDDFERYWSFLNYPFIGDSVGIRNPTIVRGWYYSRNFTEWPVFKVYDNGNREIPSLLSRNSSPDLQKHFADSRAGRNRFEISFRCPNTCTLVASTHERPDLRMSVGQTGLKAASDGNAMIYVDSVADNQNVTAIEPLKRLAAWTRVGLVQFYRIFLPLLIFAGLCASLVASTVAVKTGVPSPVLIVALAGWVLVATRITILALVDVSSFPAVNFLYAAPASFFSALAAILAIAAIAKETSVYTQSAADKLSKHLRLVWFK